MPRPFSLQFRVSYLRICDTLNTDRLCRNLDPFTETYGLSFYLQYLAHWPEYFQVLEAPNGDIQGYSKLFLMMPFHLLTMPIRSNGQDRRAW